MLRKILLLATLFAPAAVAQTYPNHWLPLAGTDRDFVRQTLQEDHPGAIDPHNPTFKQWLERGYAEAGASAKVAASLEETTRLLARYAANEIGVVPIPNYAFTALDR